MKLIRSWTAWTVDLVRGISTPNVFLIIIFGGILTYINTFRNTFVWDDIGYITANTDVQAFGLAHLFSANSFNIGLIYRPVALIFYRLLYHVFTNVPVGYHIVSIVIHIINTLLVYLLFSRFFKRHLSLFLSLIFLVHPMQVESVSYIAAVDGTMSFTLGIIAFFLETSEKQNPIALSVATVCVLLSLLLKEIGALFIVLILLYQVIFAKTKGRMVPIVMINAIVIAVYLFLRLVVGNVPFVASRTLVVPIAGLDFLHRLISVPAITFYYLKTFLYPMRLVIDQQWIVQSLYDSNFYLPLTALTLLCVILFKYGRHMASHTKNFNVYLFFIVWFSVTMTIHLQLFPLDMTVADRFFYLPMVGLLGIIGIFLHHTATPLRLRTDFTPVFPVIGIILIFLLGARTYIRNMDWYDEVTLYTHDSKIQDTSNMENNLGRAYFLKNNYKAALTHFIRSSELFQTELNMFNIGSAYDRLGNYKNAIFYYRNALTHAKLPHDEHELIMSLISKQLALVYIRLQSYDTASQFIRGALQKIPPDPILWEYLAISEYYLEHSQSALRAISEARKLVPADDSNSLYLLGQIQQGKPINLSL